MATGTPPQAHNPRGLETVSAAFDRDDNRDEQPSEVCNRCGREKPSVVKRSNREKICETCWAAMNAAEPLRDPWMRDGE